MLKSRRMRWSEYTARTWEMECIQSLRVNMTASDHLENLGTDGRIILKCVNNEQDENADWIGVSQGGDR